MKSSLSQEKFFHSAIQLLQRLFLLFRKKRWHLPVASFLSFSFRVLPWRPCQIAYLNPLRPFKKPWRNGVHLGGGVEESSYPRKKRRRPTAKTRIPKEISLTSDARRVYGAVRSAASRTTKRIWPMLLRSAALLVFGVERNGTCPKINQLYLTTVVMNWNMPFRNAALRVFGVGRNEGIWLTEQANRLKWQKQPISQTSSRSAVHLGCFAVRSEEYPIRN